MKSFCCTAALLLSGAALVSGFGPPKSLGSPEYKTNHVTPKTQFDYVVTGSPPTDLNTDTTVFPRNLATQTIQGGNSRLTYKMPPGTDRVQMLLKTNGRPLKARVELWCGPIRRTHFCDLDLMNGDQTQFRSCLKFKAVDSAGPQTLQINTKEADAFPVQVGLDVFTSAERSSTHMERFEDIWEKSTKMYSQGDGTIRNVKIEDHVRSVQLLVWAKDVGKKSFKANIELLQGPNNKRQYYEMQCGGGSQPYHAILETPGSGWTLRLTNKKTIHDGSFEFVVVPYEVDSEIDTSQPYGGIPKSTGGYTASSTHSNNYGSSLGPSGPDGPRFGTGNYGGYGSGNGRW